MSDKEGVSEGKEKKDKTFSIVLTVIGAAIGVWAFARFNSFAGALSWPPPFTEYELLTMYSAGVSVIMLIFGLKKIIS